MSQLAYDPSDIAYNFFEDYLAAIFESVVETLLSCSSAMAKDEVVASLTSTSSSLGSSDNICVNYTCICLLSISDIIIPFWRFD